MNIVQQLIAACQWDSVRYLILSANVFDPFIYYSHLLPIILSLAIGIFVFMHDRKLLGKILLFITGCFALWAFFDLVVWATDKPQLTMFFWSLEVLVEPLIYAAMFYFVYVYIHESDSPVKHKIIAGILLLPTVVLTPTRFALLGYDLTNCDRDALEGPLAHYGYLIEVIFTVWLVALAVWNFRKTTDPAKRRQIVLVTTGAVLFLAMFSWGNIVGTFIDSWDLSQWGLFGMPVFVAFLAYLIVRYKAFNMKVVGAQILVVASILIPISTFFVDTLHTSRIINGVNAVLQIILGYILVRGVKKEAEQLDEIQGLAKRLEGVLHLISHDFKGPLTQIHGFVSTVFEGDYGDVSAPLQAGLKQIDASAVKAIDAAESVLKASDAKSGRLTFDMKPMDLKQAVLDAIASVKQEAEAKGLSLTTSIPEGVDWTAMGDKVQLVEHVFRNLVANAINYTPSGSILVGLDKTNDSFRLWVKDSGVGITVEDKAKLFTEGGHGRDSARVNPHSTGYGLYLAKMVVDAHHGRIGVESEGQGKGSTFFVELLLDSAPPTQLGNSSNPAIQS